MSALRGWTVILALVACGCTQTGERRGRTLPFVVRVNQATLDLSETDEATTPPRFSSDTARLSEMITRSLGAAGIFVHVASDEGIEPDLELDIAIHGSDFGPSRVQIGGASFSTIVWLTGGGLSWLIDDRSYPESNLYMNVTIRQPRDVDVRMWAEPSKPVYDQNFRLNDFELSFLERAGGTDWLLNLVVPPCFRSGDPELAGESLAREVVDFFASEVPDRILTALPWGHQNALGSFLVHDHGEAVIIVADRRLEKLAFVQSGRVVGPPQEADDLDLCRILDETHRDGIVDRLAQEELNLDLKNRFLYRVPLPPGSRGFIRVEALVGAAAVRWTIEES